MLISVLATSIRAIILLGYCTCQISNCFSKETLQWQIYTCMQLGSTSSIGLSLGSRCACFCERRYTLCVIRDNLILQAHKVEGPMFFVQLIRQWFSNLYVKPKKKKNNNNNYLLFITTLSFIVSLIFVPSRFISFIEEVFEMQILYRFSIRAFKPNLKVKMKVKIVYLRLH